MSKTEVYILGIESSCDETSAAIVYNGKVLANIVANQEVHKSYGGVVPELASRAHQQNIVPVVDEAIKKAGIQKEKISAVGFTSGPGLMGSLLVGTSFAKSFSYALNIPLIEVNHMQAHIFANFIGKEPSFPFLCLTVSGGHTQIVLVKDYFDMKIIGETIDDAAGEAFDKSAKIMSLPYPGGPLIDKFAQTGDPEKFKFPHPNIPGYNFSFSGLKTSILYFLQKEILKNSSFVEENLNDLCASIQHTIIGILLEKLRKASAETGINEIAIAGGVSANSGLRKAVQQEKKWNVHIPAFEYCTDNAAMIAITAYHKFLKEDFSRQNITAKAKMDF